ncbi:uncharacterized protein LOC131881579 [Tigriopus californicus]|nr:uncharacterized protein LOC131881579 [Tigriopus californicus]
METPKISSSVPRSRRSSLRRGEDRIRHLLMALCLMITWTISSSHANGPPDTTLCPLNEYIDDSDETVREFFECPGLEDPPDHRLCCEEKCCPLVEIDSVLKVDIRIAMIISLSVICLCVFTGIVIVLCCFISSCPLYDVCLGGWGSDEAPKNYPPYLGPGYIPSDMHPLTLNGGSKITEKEHTIADGISPIKLATDADHV